MLKVAWAEGGPEHKFWPEDPNCQNLVTRFAKVIKDKMVLKQSNHKKMANVKDQDEGQRKSNLFKNVFENSSP